MTTDSKIKDSKIKAKKYALMSKYGLTIEEWNQMLIAQGGVCWMCQKLPKSGVLCVDHRHVPGYKKLGPEEKKKEVRALLCFMCNTTLSNLEKRNIARQVLNKMVEYFSIYKLKGDI